VAHTYNPRYSEGRQSGGSGLKPAQAISSQDPISKRNITKKGWWVAQGVGPAFKPRSLGKKKKSKVNT
jgi:hypothetical protein